MARLRRWSSRVLLLGLPLALLLAAAWLLGTEAGLRFALARADAALAAGGGRLAWRTAQGTLAGPARIEGLELERRGLRLAVERLSFDLRPDALLVGRLQAESLDASGVRIVVTPDPTAPPFALPDRIALPLHLALERFTVSDLEIAVGARPPIAIAQAGGAASADARGLRLTDLELVHALGTLRGRLATTSAQPYPVDGALELALARPSEPIAVVLGLGGRIEALELDARSAAPLALHAALTLRDPFGAPRATGRIECAGVELARVDAALAALAPATLDCALDLDATAAATAVRGELTLAHPAWRPATLTLALSATPAALTLERGDLVFAGAPTRAVLRGRLALDQARLPFSLTAAIERPALPTRAPGAPFAASATFALEGDRTAIEARLGLADGATGVLDAYAVLTPATGRYTLEAEARDWRAGIARVTRATLVARGDRQRAELKADATVAARGVEAALDARGAVTREALTLDSLGAALLGGRLDGKGRVAFGAAGPAWQAEFVARGLDPRGVDARFPGAVDARLVVDGGPRATRIAVSALGGTLRGKALGGGGVARVGAGLGPWFAPELALESLKLTSGGATLEGAFDARRTRFALEAPDLADLLPAARGRLGGRVHGEGDALALELAGAGLVVGGFRLAQLDAALELPPQGAARGTLSARGLLAADLAADEVTLALGGERTALTLELTGRRGEARLAASARGALIGDAFEGRLEKVELAPVGAPAWTLAAPAAVRVSGAGLTLAEACLGDGAARGCLGGGWHPLEPWRVRGQVERLGIGLFGGWLARGLDYQGSVDLALDVAGDGPRLGDAKATLALSQGRILQPARRQRAARGADAPAEAPLELLRFEGGRIAVARDAAGLRAEARFDLAGRGTLELDLRAQGDGPLERRPLSGRLRADLDQFALLPALLPELKKLEGRFSADLTLAGTVAEPRYAGRIAFSEGSATLPRLGLELSELAAELTGDGDALTFSGSARSGGTVRWRADVKRSEGRWRASGRLWGERFEAVDVPEARVLASPALLLELDGRDLKVSGEIVVPRANLQPRSLASAVQSTGDEVILTAEGGGGEAERLRLDARVRLKLGDEVKFDGFGLKAKVRGEITVTERPDALAIASGELAVVDGKYEAYGQDLVIERGRLLFSGGPLGNPGLDVRAKRVVERPGESSDVVVGIDVRGTLRDPTTTLFATPAMSSSDALAYLVLGRPLAESSDAEEAQLTDAASRMRLSGGEFLAQQIGRRIGLDEVRISDSDDPAEAQLWLGTYLSPRLFVSYGMGLFEQFHTARVRYQISSKWSVEAESGRENSADIKYTIER